MSRKLHENAVLTGALDYLCLVCEYHTQSKEAANKHVNQPDHQKNLETNSHLDQYPGDCIRQLKTGFYCEYCNQYLQTGVKVTLHVTADQHISNKGNLNIKRIGTNIVIYNDILIPESTWNGIILTTCALCNEEISDLKLHIAEAGHVINLIQNKVQYGEGCFVYRKVDETFFHCLICNLLFSLSFLQIHYKNEKHEANVKKCREFFQANLDNTKNERKNEESNAKKPMKNDHVNNIIEIKQNGTKPVQNDLNNNKTNESKSDVSKRFFDDKKSAKDTTEVPTVDKKNISKTNIENDPTEKQIDESKDVEKLANKAVKEESKIDMDNNLKKSDKKAKKAKAKVAKQNISNEKETKENVKPLEKTKITNDNTLKQNCKVITLVPEDSTKESNQKADAKTDKDELLDCVAEFQKNGIDFNFETEKVFCKRCFMNISLNLSEIKQHIKDHKSNPTKHGPNVLHKVDKKNSRTVLDQKEEDESPSYKTDVKQRFKLDDSFNKTTETNTNDTEEIIKIDLTKKGTKDEEMAIVPRSAKTPPQEAEKITPAPENKPTNTENIDSNDPATFAKANKLTYNKDNKNAYCRICNIRVPSSIRNMKEHVNGGSHKKKVAIIAANEKVVPKRPMDSFIKHVSTIMDVSGTDDVILNDKLCLTRLSYHMITKQNKLRCQACEVNLKENEVARHLDSIFHERAMTITPVVWTLDKEFVREVRPGLFHCGFCNLIVGVWEDVAKHLKCTDHVEYRSDAESRLEEHMPAILEHRKRREHLFLRAMMQSFGGGFFF